MADASARGHLRLVGPLSGIVSVVLVFVGSAAIAGTSGPGRHSLDASVDEVGEYVADADLVRVWIGEFVGLLGFALFLVFAAFLRGVVGRTAPAGRDWLGGLLLPAAAIHVALTAAGIASLAPALNRDVEPAAAAAFLDLRTTLLGLAFVFLGLWLVGVGVLGLRARALPAWLAWSAVAIGVLELAMTPLAAYDPGFTGIPTFAAFLWVLVASSLFLRRGLRGPGPDSAA